MTYENGGGQVCSTNGKNFGMEVLTEPVVFMLLRNNLIAFGVSRLLPRLSVRRTAIGYDPFDSSS